MMTSCAGYSRKEAADPLIREFAQRFRGSTDDATRLSYVPMLVWFRTP